ncbi:amidohydrolase [Siccirubricoccus sp. G192]|uniref:amidohydrolase n=1 Tax=Siccirubricoccus sp. G192 TaxID=2849651 RepID=UPI001C2C5BF2|nr:amidohydrolase [Siccirubricoccus sp. G192]MBV1799184.1 amidohydrolase [Siccirubricoccus sp. G192]
MLRLIRVAAAPWSCLRAEAIAPALSRRGLLAAVCACCAAGVLAPVAAGAQIASGAVRPLHGRLDVAAAAIEARMIAWRRDIHQSPELGNQEVRTAALVATHLRRLGYDVREQVAVTGVVGTLRGDGGDGPVLALRADMDALPVTEPAGLPFASRVRTIWAGEETGVMHACGHDCHTAILLAVAEVLAAHRAELRGTVKLLFQPAEEGLPNFEVGGARRMLDEGAFENPRPDAVMALHMVPFRRLGEITYTVGTTNASGDEFRIAVQGRQTHAAFPWSGVDPIVVGAQIVTALQTIASREVNVVRSPVVISVGSFRAGNRSNIIPNRAELTGTLRAFDDAARIMAQRRVKEIAEGVAASMNATAEVVWSPAGIPSNANDPALAGRMAPTLARIAGPGKLVPSSRGMALEDFSYFSRVVPGLFFNIGVTPAGVDPATAAPNHSPLFKVDEAALLVGLRAMLHLVADYTGSGSA